MKTLLVSVQSNTDTIGLKYLHAYLQANRINSHILFLPVYDNNDFGVIKRFLEKFQPGILGISFMSHEFHKARDLCREIKKGFPGITLVAGGLHPSVEPEECLNFCDFVFIGESEQSLLKFAQAIQAGGPVEGISNLAYRSSGRVIRNELMPLNENLDALPFPEHCPSQSFILGRGQVVKLTKALFEKYSRYSGKFYSLTTTRGCPFSCTFCCNSFFVKLYGKRIIRQRSVNNVIEELKEAIKLFPDIVYINIQDDCFFAYDTAWLKEFAKRYKKEIKRNFTSRTTPNHITDEKVGILKEAGLSWIFMGLQTGSERINREIYKRYVSNEKSLNATRIVRKYNVAAFYDIILDNPYETEEDLLKTVELVLEIPKPFQLQLCSLCFYHGTELRKRAEQDKLLAEDPLSKNYLKYHPTLINQVIRLIPLFPRRFIYFLLRNRKSPFKKALVKIIYSLSVLLLEPLLWMKLIYISFDNNLKKTANMIFSFFYTGFRRTMFKK